MDHKSLAAHIEWISTRTNREADCFVTTVVRGCWPCGPDDRTEPAALEWVRRWGPSHHGGTFRDCSCAEGRCLVCN